MKRFFIHSDPKWNGKSILWKDFSSIQTQNEMVSPFYERIFHPFRPKMKCGRYKACQMGKHLTGTTNSMWHWSFDLVVGQSYIRKIFLKFLFYCTRIMINILIIFLTQYFFYKNDLLIRISPCNQKV
jgi:hypothetical protein